jgi:hypothetical protein
MAGGRPTKYSKELADEICAVVSKNFDSLMRICAERPHFPTKETVLEWRRINKEFSAAYDVAKRTQAELTSEKLKEVNNKVYEYTYIDQHGNKKIDPGAVAAAKLESDNVRFIGIKLAQHLYGDKTETVVTLKYEDVLRQLKNDK